MLSEVGKTCHKKRIYIMTLIEGQNNSLSLAPQHKQTFISSKTREQKQIKGCNCYREVKKNLNLLIQKKEVTLIVI